MESFCSVPRMAQAASWVGMSYVVAPHAVGTAEGTVAEVPVTVVRAVLDMVMEREEVVF